MLSIASSGYDQQRRSCHNGNIFNKSGGTTKNNNYNNTIHKWVPLMNNLKVKIQTPTILRTFLGIHVFVWVLPYLGAASESKVDSMSFLTPVWHLCPSPRIAAVRQPVYGSGMSKSQILQEMSSHSRKSIEGHWCMVHKWLLISCRVITILVLSNYCMVQ